MQSQANSAHKSFTNYSLSSALPALSKSPESKNERVNTQNTDTTRIFENDAIKNQLMLNSSNESIEKSYQVYQRRMSKLIESRKMLSPMMRRNKKDLDKAKDIQSMEMKKFLKAKEIQLQACHKRDQRIVLGIPTVVVGHKIKHEFLKSRGYLMKRTYIMES